MTPNFPKYRQISFFWNYTSLTMIWSHSYKTKISKEYVIPLRFIICVMKKETIYQAKKLFQSPDSSLLFHYHL